MRTLFSFLFSSFLFSQSLSIISELDTTQGFIGDIFQWTVKVEGQDNQTIRFPELEVTNDTISIRNQTLIHENGKLIGIEFEIVAWDTGYFITPDYAIEILKTDEPEARAAGIKVGSVDELVGKLKEVGAV